MDKILLVILSVYLVIINITAFALMGIDKKRAIEHKWRISEAALFISALLFGGLGSTIGMWHFRHKTKHWYFVLGMPLIMLIESGLLIFTIINILKYLGG